MSRILIFATLSCCLVLVSQAQPTTADKLLALTQPPIWSADTVVTDLGGNPHTRLVTIYGDTSYASGDYFAGDTLRTWLAHIGGVFHTVDPTAGVSADTLYAWPPWMGQIPQAMLLEWATGVGWKNRTEVGYPLLQVYRQFQNQ